MPMMAATGLQMVFFNIVTVFNFLNASAANQKRAGDIIYLWTDEGWVYLATMIDLYSRAVIGRAVSERMPADRVRMTLSRRHYPTGVIVHSDRGSQYCSARYQGLLKQYDLRCSMSGKGNCYDNVCAECVFHSRHPR